MGVTCVEAFVEQPKYFNKEIYLNAKKAVLNVLYRSDEVYKECSVPVGKNIKRRTKNKIVKPKFSRVKCGKQNSMCTLYESPTIILENKENSEDETHDTGEKTTLDAGLDNTALDAGLNTAYDIISLCDKQSESNASVCIKLLEHNVKTECQIPTCTFDPRVKYHKKRNPCKWIGLPKFVCPCCTGGDDNADAPYKAQSIVNSCESIYGQRAPSTVYSIKDSVLNASNHHKDFKLRNTMKFYTKLSYLYKVCYKNRLNDDKNRKYTSTRNTKTSNRHFFVYAK